MRLIKVNTILTGVTSFMALGIFVSLFLISSVSLSSPTACLDYYDNFSAKVSENARQIKAYFREQIEIHGLAIAIHPYTVEKYNEHSGLSRDIFGGIPVYAADSEARVVQRVREVLFYGTHGNEGHFTSPLSIGYSKRYNNSDKISDWNIARTVDPRVIPSTVVANEIFTETELFDIRATPLGEKTKASISNLAKNLVQRSLQKYPKGAIFKLKDDYRTADQYGLLTTENIENLLQSSNLNHLLEEQIVNKNFNVKDFVEVLKGRKAKYKKADRVLNLLGDIISNPENVLVQELVNIQKIAGHNVEIRVDFVDGVAMTAATRYGFSYLPEINEKAMNFLNEFLYRSQSKFPALTGGADIVLLTDGTFKILEFNLGNFSAYRHPRYEPIAANWFLTILQGKRTKLIAEFTKTMTLPLTDQLRYLQQFSLKKNKYILKKEEIYVPEVIAFFRDASLDYYRQGSDRFPNPRSVLDYVKDLIRAIPHASETQQHGHDLNDILETTRLYFENPTYGHSGKR